MKTYRLIDKDTLTLSINGGDWQKTVFRKSKFKDIGQATTDEIVAALDKVSGLDAHKGDGGELLLSTEETGRNATLEVDLTDSSSTAAAALGLGAQSATGTGIAPAKLVSAVREPFKIADGDKLSLGIDGKKRRVTFKGAVTAGAATAREVAAAINKFFKNSSAATHDGRVAITSPTLGPQSSAEIFDVAESRKTAKALGFTAANVLSRPFPTTPATLSCKGEACLCMVNLTSQPIELHLPGGPMILGREAVPISAVQAGTSRLRRLHERGLIGFKSM
jgi:hypothetical protein